MSSITTSEDNVRVERTPATSGQNLQIEAELISFRQQFEGGAPVPGTALEAAYRLAEADGVAATDEGRSLLRQIADNFSELGEHHTQKANGNSESWHRQWAEHCRERSSTARIMADS